MWINTSQKDISRSFEAASTIEVDPTARDSNSLTLSFGFDETKQPKSQVKTLQEAVVENVEEDVVDNDAPHDDGPARRATTQPIT